MEQLILLCLGCLSSWHCLLLRQVSCAVHTANLSLIFLTVDEKDEVSISTVAETIAQAFGFEGEIRYDSTQADGQFKKTASNAKLRSYVPNFQFTPFEQAINSTVQWFKENCDTARK